jgi:Domain of unknown function (DUF5666)
MKRAILATFVAIVLSFALPNVVQAHEGHTHKVMGTVSAINGQHVEVKQTDGKTVTVMLDKDTTVTRGKEKLDASALKVGEKISVDAMQEKNMMMAHAIKLAAVPAATTKKK